MRCVLSLEAEDASMQIHRRTGIPSVMKGPCNARSPAERPITKLPVELVIRIMRSGLDPPSQRSLSQVSRSFRDVSFLLPELWSTVVPKFPLEEDQLDYWKRSMVNSKTAPLDIKFTISDQNPSSDIDQSQGFLSLFLELVIHTTRWRTFFLVTELPGPMNAFLKGTFSAGVFPQLESLRLACAEPVGTHEAAWSTYGRSGEPSPIMPRLRNLALWNVWAHRPGGLLNDLVSLKIVGDLLGTAPPLEDIVSMLKSSPNLEVLYLTAAPPLLNNLSPPPVTNEALHVVLPHLRSLTFRGLSRMAGICTLPLLHLPVLEEFHLENTLAWLDSCIDVPDRPQVLEDYSSVIQIITCLGMPWRGSSDVFIAPPGPQWPLGKLKELTLSWVTAEAMPLFEWLSFMRELTTLRIQFSDTDLLRVLQDGSMCPRLQTLYVGGFINPITRNELERVMGSRPDLEVLVETNLAGPCRISSSLL